jgi:hypothetical protein
MHVGVMEQVLSPRVQDGEETDARAQMFGVGRKGLQGSGAGFQEDPIDHPGIAQRQIVEWRGDGEDQMEIIDRQ